MSFARYLVGLGNPDVPEYARTRHNAGRRAVRLFAQKHGGSFRAGRNRLECEIGAAEERILCILPETYMNRSAQALGYPATARTAAGETLVLSDDIHIAAGRIRIRPEGGAGGHNGLASLIEILGEGFPRIRIGVGPADGREIPPSAWSDFVLSDARDEEGELLAHGEALAAEAAAFLIEKGISEAMNRYNTNA